VSELIYRPFTKATSPRQKNPSTVVSPKGFHKIGRART